MLLKRGSGVSLERQVTEQLRDAICSGRLEAGGRLPSSRQLAASLQVDRNVVVNAFETLLSEGYLTSRAGSGTFVTTDVFHLLGTPHPYHTNMHRWTQQPVPEPQTDPAADPGLINFALGQPSVDDLDRAAWRAIWRNVGYGAASGDYGTPEGFIGLRLALAHYLHRARGLLCSAEDIVITGGTTQALNLIARATIAGGDTVAFEEPGYPLARQVLNATGASLLPVGVDDDGLRVNQLPTGEAAPLLVYCTPSHQYPLGSRLSLPRRTALLEWARRYDALILEDDYDGEFRFETAPLPALASLGQDCTVYLGTFSKTITPSLRVGFIVAPPALRERLVRVKTLSDYHTSLPVQMALAQFIQEGHFERHIRRMRRVYAVKRALLLDSLELIRDLAPLKGLEAGLHAHIKLPEAAEACRVAERAKSLGVGVSTLAPYYSGQPIVNGLLLGYGALSPKEIQIGGQALARAVIESLRAGIT